MTSEIAQNTGQTIRVRQRSVRSRLLRAARRSPLGTIGVVIVAVFLFAGAFAELVAPYGYSETNLFDSLESPSRTYWFGTDDLGRDVFSRVVFGARISIVVGATAVAAATIGAVTLGLLSGYIGGWLDLILQRLVDAWLAFPPLVIVLTLVAIFQPGIPTLILALALGELFRFSRVIRGSVLQVKSEAYIDAAILVGNSDVRVMWRHILPNIFPIVLVLITISLGVVILVEATLSFLGYGIPPPFPSWGQMLSGAGAQYFYQAPWMAIFPGLAISFAVFGFSMAGDALRDILDPRMRGR